MFVRNYVSENIFLLLSLEFLVHKHFTLKVIDMASFVLHCLLAVNIAKNLMSTSHSLGLHYFLCQNA